MSITTSQINSRGFTIVELLIVIVIIAILAAITIVAYNGITAKANASSAQAASNVAVKKAEAYNAEISNYPAYPSLLTSAPSTTTYYLYGVSFSDLATDPSTGTPVAPSGPSQLLYYSCTTGAGVKYWNNTLAAANKWVAISIGGAPTSLTGCTYKRASATS